jgi:hypothetical protein
VLRDPAHIRSLTAGKDGNISHAALKPSKA